MRDIERRLQILERGNASNDTITRIKLILATVREACENPAKRDKDGSVVIDIDHLFPLQKN